jgi:hypothetical protein
MPVSVPSNNAPRSDAITAKAPIPAPPAATAAKPAGGNFTLLAGLIGGVLLLCVLPAAGLGLGWYFSRPKPTEDDSPKNEIVHQPKDPIPEEPKESDKSKDAPPEMDPKIRAAIDKGAAHLKKRLLEKGGPLSHDKRFLADTPTGAAALAGLALLEAKTPPSDPAVQKALAAVRENGPNLRIVYAIGACVFFLNRLHDIEPLNPSDRELVRSMSLRLIAGQQKGGYWNYINPPISKQAEDALLKRLRDNTYKPQGTNPESSSHSMTQFALLALWGSARHDVPVRPALLAAAQHFQKTQANDGTWGYGVAKGNALRVDSNTCAGLMSLAMEQTLREDKRYRGDAVDEIKVNPLVVEQQKKGFAHLASVIGRTNDDPSKKWVKGKLIRAHSLGDLYFLWSLERVAVIYDLKLIGGKDWYAWGSEHILDNQQSNGSWVDLHGDVCDTCFAILFLTRANLAKDLTESIRTRGGKAAIP